MSDLIQLSISELGKLLASREVSAVEATTACLERIEATEPTLHALLHVRAEEALAEAKALDAAGPDAAKPLWGVPVTVKDVICTKGTPTTCGSKMLENFTPFYSAHVVEKLTEAGAVVLGKNNMDEFAMGSSTENSAYGPTMNPWDTSRVPGGSSGGSAASVAARQSFASLGTDTGGSIRQPASLCGCVGVKPSYGRVSRYGLVAFGSSLDQPGPLTRTVDDAALILQTIAGHDERDGTCVKAPVPGYAARATAMREQGLKSVTVGLPVEYWSEGLDPEVERCLKKTIETVESLGGTVKEVSLPHTKYAVASYYVIAPAEASANLARFDGVRYGHRAENPDGIVDLYTRSRSEGFGDEVQRRIMLGAYVLSAGYYDAYFRKAARVRRLIRQDFLNALDQCDVLMGAVSPVTAWKLGELTADPLKMYLMDVFTIPTSMAGLPGVSIPAGLGDESGMPVGVQLIGPAFGEEDVLGVAAALEGALPAIGAPRGL